MMNKDFQYRGNEIANQKVKNTITNQLNSVNNNNRHHIIFYMALQILSADDTTDARPTRSRSEDTSYVR